MKLPVHDEEGARSNRMPRPDEQKRGAQPQLTEFGVKIRSPAAKAGTKRKGSRKNGQKDTG